MKIQKIVKELIESKLIKSTNVDAVELILSKHVTVSTNRATVAKSIIIEDVEYYYCKWSRAYYIRDYMVFANGKCRNYSKSAYKRWRATLNEINKLRAEAAKLIATNVEAAQKLAADADALAAILNDVSNFDARRDFAAYTNVDFDTVAVIEE